jgi:hypothetical protein
MPADTRHERQEEFSNRADFDFSFGRPKARYAGECSTRFSVGNALIRAPNLRRATRIS